MPQAPPQHMMQPNPYATNVPADPNMQAMMFQMMQNPEMMQKFMEMSSKMAGNFPQQPPQ
jgi:hypothetical protein